MCIPRILLADAIGRKTRLFGKANVLEETVNCQKLTIIQERSIDYIVVYYDTVNNNFHRDFTFLTTFTVLDAVIFGTLLCLKVDESQFKLHFCV